MTSTRREDWEGTVRLRRNARALPALHFFFVLALALTTLACHERAPLEDASLPKTEAVTPRPGVKPDRAGPSGAELDRHVDDASAEVRRAEEQLEQSLARKVGPPTVQVPPTDPKQPKPPAPSEPLPQEGCPVACKALASMRRSSEYLCKLSGEADLRCVDARQRVARAEQRVRSAACACEEKVTRSFFRRGTSDLTCRSSTARW